MGVYLVIIGDCTIAVDGVRYKLFPHNVLIKQNRTTWTFDGYFVICCGACEVRIRDG